jgi:hypothetical protein
MNRKFLTILLKKLFKNKEAYLLVKESIVGIMEYQKGIRQKRLRNTALYTK